jgi:hypothetical protein
MQMAYAFYIGHANNQMHCRFPCGYDGNGSASCSPHLAEQDYSWLMNSKRALSGTDILIQHPNESTHHPNQALMPTQMNWQPPNRTPLVKMSSKPTN